MTDYSESRTHKLTIASLYVPGGNALATMTLTSKLIDALHDEHCFTCNPTAYAKHIESEG